jgi:hypothetical protein
MPKNSAVQRHRERNRAKGLCRYCPDAAAPDHSVCPKHLQKRRSVMHREYITLRDRRRALGFCLFCLNPGFSGYGCKTLLCELHREKLKKWSLSYYRRVAGSTGRGTHEPLRYPFLANTDHPIDGIDLLLAINQKVPKHLPPELRAEMGQELAVAILEGKIKLEEIDSHVPKVLKALNREYPIKYGPLSIDQPIRGSDTLLKEMI